MKKPGLGPVFFMPATPFIYACSMAVFAALDPLATASQH
jgi:hypothetical protein